MKKCPWCGQEYSDGMSVCALDQNALESCSPSPRPEESGVDRVVLSEAPPQETKDGGVSDGFRWLDVCDASEADRLLKQLSEADISFRIDRIERRERSGATSYRTVGLIEIFVHHEDYERAKKIRTADWKV